MEYNGAQLVRLEEKHAALEERLTAKIAEFNRADIAREKALNLQASEYERRLEKLNGEHERLNKMQIEMQSQTQARADLEKTFTKIDANDRAVVLRMTGIDDRVTNLEGAARESQGRAWLPNLAWAAAASGVGIWLWNLLGPK